MVRWQEPLLECVPNFSEGSDPAVVEALQKAILAVPGVRLLHVDTGADANRTVFTFAGPPIAVTEAAIASAEVALARIDMRQHMGSHPRIGALDVCPFVPLGPATMAEAKQAANALAERLGARGVPVWLYEESARAPHLRKLSDCRKGEYEGLAQKLIRPEWRPDFGPSAPHPTAGATVTGARGLLVAWNINLKHRDEELAKRIASAIREKNSGLPGLRAIGWDQPELGVTQVSCNLTLPERLPLHVVYEKVRRLALGAGNDVAGSEPIGLFPLETILEAGRHYAPRQQDETALLRTAIYELGLGSLRPFDPERKIVENALSNPPYPVA
jgi:glutamate formiminotransferase/formiminotetrahydrofolate cyclodeaminase